MNERLDRAIAALLDYQQADEDGIMVLASRQAIHEVADELKRLREAMERTITAWDVLKHGNYTRDIVETWLEQEMKPAIDAARSPASSQDRGAQ